MKTVLIADDNIDFNSKCRDFLTKDNTINIIQSFDGKDTLEKYFEVKPDVLILDYRLPKLNGIKVLKHINKHEPKNDKRNVIFITGSPIVNTDLFNCPNIYNCFSKPVNLNRLLDAVNEIYEFNKNTEDKVKKDIENYLSMLGLENANSNNYKYLVHAIYLVITNESLWENLKIVYYLVGKKYNKRDKDIENHIYYNIKQIRKYMPKEYLNSIFGVYSKYDKFTPKLFLDMTAVYFKDTRL